MGGIILVARDSGIHTDTFLEEEAVVTMQRTKPIDYKQPTRFISPLGPWLFAHSHRPSQAADTSYAPLRVIQHKIEITKSGRNHEEIIPDVQACLFVCS
jgi:hypothetical protein